MVEDFLFNLSEAVRNDEEGYPPAVKNTLTAFIDLGQVYGSRKETEDLLRLCTLADMYIFCVCFCADLGKVCDSLLQLCMIADMYCTSFVFASLATASCDYV